MDRPKGNGGILVIQPCLFGFFVFPGSFSPGQTHMANLFGEITHLRLISRGFTNLIPLFSQV